MRRKGFSISLLLVMGCWMIGAAGQVILNAEADATIKRSSPGQTFGDDDVLIASRNGKSSPPELDKIYIRFNASQLGEIKDIVSLDVFNLLSTGAPREGIVFLLIGDDRNAWNEKALTWKNAPATGKDHNLSARHGLRMGRIAKPEKKSPPSTLSLNWLEDGPKIKQSMLRALNSGDRTVTLVVSTTSQSVEYASRENKTEGAHPPRMILEEEK